MEPLFATIAGLLVSLAVIPLMVQAAPLLGMLDQPGVRKVHANPTPRIGGWGVVLGAVTTVGVGLPPTPLSLAFVVGALFLFLAGAVDDSRDLRPTVKLAAQVLAALPVVTYAGLVVPALPLPGFGELTLPAGVAMTLTLIGVVACVNAANTADGLDGLAGGITLLSLCGILYLAHVGGSSQLLFITAAAAGALFGFLRYNTHPAVIFMGDSGSQFLGFTVAFLALALTQPEAGGHSPWLVLMLVGLPLIDLTVVALGRLRAGRSCFSADRTHLHHRLLDLGLSHKHSVVLIYTIQASFVLFGLLLHDSGDTLLAVAYGAHVALIYGLLTLAGHWLQRTHGGSYPARAPAAPRQTLSLLDLAPRAYLAVAVPATLVAGALLAESVPGDFGILAVGVLLLLLLSMRRYRRPRPLFARIPYFLLAAAVIYLYTDSRAANAPWQWVELAVFLSLGLATLLAVAFSPRRRNLEFHTQAGDYLLFLALGALLLTGSTASWSNFLFVLYLLIVLYASEILMIDIRRSPDWLSAGAILAALVLGLRAVG